MPHRLLPREMTRLTQMLEQSGMQSKRVTNSRLEFRSLVLENSRLFSSCSHFLSPRERTTLQRPEGTPNVRPIREQKALTLDMRPMTLFFR